MLTGLIWLIIEERMRGFYGLAVKLFISKEGLHGVSLIDI
jgi:hypothetical protein